MEDKSCQLWLERYNSPSTKRLTADAFDYKNMSSTASKILAKSFNFPDEVNF
jgi:hypothetical protein